MVLSVHLTLLELLRRGAARKSGGGDIDTKAVGLWAIDNGYQVNARGRIQSDIIEKYQAAN
ncbi:Lsr2 family protein [Pseudarthrobacter sp. NS4]|uniref:Lsr2 family protein n=1 Tax=Pseudarthrobacter sp. NS4 TaxID=2973976 RepID=UPI0021622D31|nr:Lsr2 family protein [Pseudarthrobacter sp. NS4]